MACQGCKKLKFETAPAMPSGGRLVWNFLKSLRRVAMGGERYVSVDEVKARLAVCETCNLRVDNRCSHEDCGCYLDLVPLNVPVIGGMPGRAHYRALDCPMELWPTDVVETSPRHLLYHIMPTSGKGVWQWNVEQLKKRIELFNGKRIIAVVTDAATDPYQDVKAAFDDVKIDEFIMMPNSPQLREVQTWPALWERVVGEPGVTWYGHAKGVTRPLDHGTIRRWAELMYSVCLDYWPVVEDQLRKFPATGPLKKIGKGFAGSESAWHYSGTFWWVRNSAMKPIYKEIDVKWFGNEAFLGLHFHENEVGCLFGEGPIERVNMYDPETMTRFEGEFQQWKSAHELNHSATL